MDNLVWKPEYSIGDFRIDYEHKKLIQLANKVIHFAVPGEAKEKIEAALRALIQYTKIHFKNEERYMQRIGYVGLERQQRRHAELIAQMARVMAEYTSLDDLVIRLKRLMVVWVIGHIIKEDSKISSG